jgi:hypothetical protein
MSKIITKKQLNLVMESSIEEVGNMMEGKEEMKLTKQHMDELEKEGHCMCDDKCLVYWEGVKNDDSKMKSIMDTLAAEKTNCVMISKAQMDMLHKDGKCECDDNVSLSYDENMAEGDYMNDMGDDMKSEGDYMNDDTTKESACNECGGTMVEGVCEGCSGMSEELHGDQKELDKNENGKIDSEDLAILRGGKEKEVTEISVGEKKYKVVEESVNKITESLSKNIDKKVIKEEMDFFNKMINYKK